MKHRKLVNSPEELLITTSELNKLTRLNTQNLTGTKVTQNRGQKKAFVDKRVSEVSRDYRWAIIVFSTPVFMLCYPWLLSTLPTTFFDWVVAWLVTTFRAAIVATLFFCLSDLIFTFLYRQKINKMLCDPELKTLRDLLDEIDKYNEVAKDLIANLSALEQLYQAGSNVSLQDSAKLLNALKLMKKDLVRALTIERIFRENPRVSPDRINIDFTPFKALQINERAVDYSNCVNSLIEIGTSVQTEINTLSAKGTAKKPSSSLPPTVRIPRTVKNPPSD